MNEIVKKLKRLLRYSQHDIENPSDKDIAEFFLHYDNFLIGNLRFEDGMWYFAYSEEFKNQNRYSTIANFPRKEIEYKTSDLRQWPFFTLRIPTKAQMKTTSPDSVDSDAVSLLRQFGNRAIANPYRLLPAYV